MYKLVGRILDGQKVVGYQVTDGAQTKPMSKQDVMNLAKQQLIANVKVSGDTLTGTNGFEIKSLPSVNTQDSNSLLFCELNAALIRHVSNLDVSQLQSTDKRYEIAKQLAQQDLASGKLNKSMMHINSNNISIEMIVKNEKLPQLVKYLRKFEPQPENIEAQIKQSLQHVTNNNSSIDAAQLVCTQLLPLFEDKIHVSNGVYADKHDELIMTPAVGYVVKANNLRSTLNFDKLVLDTAATLGSGSLDNGGMTLMSKSELAIMSSRLTINGELSNASLRYTSKKQDSNLTLPRFLFNWHFSPMTGTDRFKAMDIADFGKLITLADLVRFMPIETATTCIQEIIQMLHFQYFTNIHGNTKGMTMAEIYDKAQASINKAQAKTQDKAHKKDHSKGLLNMFKR